MKKIFFIAVLAISSIANAQDMDTMPPFNPFIYKGDWLASGTLAWSTAQYKGMSNTKLNSLTLTPDYGYFITNRLAAGLRLHYTKYDQPNLSSGNNFSDFQVAPYLRYYILPATSKTNILGDISYGFGSEGGNNKESFNYFGVMAGPAFFLNQNTSLELVGSYKSWGGDAYPDRENEIGVWLGFQNHLRCSFRSPWSPQIDKGDWLAGGGLWYSSSSLSGVSNSRTNYFTADPQLGYFFGDGLAGGLKLNYTSTKFQSQNDAYTNFSAEPFARYYILPKKNRVNLFGEVGYGFGSQGMATKESYNFWEAMAGPAFFLSPHTSLEAGLTYRSYGGDLYSTKYNQFGISVNYQVLLGGRY